MGLGIDGVGVGHWTDPVARTGCTVVLLPEGTVASGEVRGGAPATREFALLDPQCLVDGVDAVVLTGGSAFGLASADGVVGRLEAAGRGFPTAAGPVPIVVALGLFDLLVGDRSVRPGPVEGAAAYDAAIDSVRADARPESGPVGAGAGATTGKWRGRGDAQPSGLGCAVLRDGELVVAALFAVNAFGDVVAADHDVGDSVAVAHEAVTAPVGNGAVGGNTTIGVVVTNAALDKAACHLVAQRAHDGLARAIVPAHTMFDGDAVVAAATGAVPLDGSGPSVLVATERVRLLAAAATEQAVRAAAGSV